MDSKEAWDNIQGPKDFDTYYNLFSSKLQQYRTLRGDNTHSDNRRINQVDTGGRGRGHGGYSGRGRGRGRGHGRGRGRGRGSYSNNPYQSQQGLPNFTAEARNYPQDMFHKMSKMQKAAVQQAKINDGWKDGRTPPDGFTVNGDGYAIPSPSVIAAVQSHFNIGQFQQVPTPGSGAPLPPPPPPRAPAPAPSVPAPSPLIMQAKLSARLHQGEEMVMVMLLALFLWLMDVLILVMYMMPMETESLDSYASCH